MIGTVNELVQWNTYEKLVIETDERYDEVHFYNKFCSNALSVKPNENGEVYIPNILLQTADNITVWLVEVDGETRTSVERAVLEVAARLKPDDYVYTEIELLSYRSLEERIEKLEQGGVTPGPSPTPTPTPGSGMTEEEKQQLNKNTEDIATLNGQMRDVENSVGEIDSALDRIIEIQNSLIGGGSE